jgi:hypothetical protein
VGRVPLEHAEAILDRMSAGPRADRIGRADGGRAPANRRVPDRDRNGRAARDRGLRPRPPGRRAVARRGRHDRRRVAPARGRGRPRGHHALPEFDGTDVEVVDPVDDELLVALPATHPLAKKPRLRLRDLRDETWIEAAGHGTQPTLLAAAARAHGFETRVRFAAEQWTSKQGVVAAGVGITVIPGLAVATVRDDIVLRSLGKQAPRRRVVVLLPAGYPGVAGPAPPRRGGGGLGLGRGEVHHQRDRH